MNSVVKTMRLQIAVFGRTNTGKSSLINFLTDQNVSITSPLAGTTTDTVEKAMEFAPFGPVVFIDTAGLDDRSELGAERINRALKIFARANVAILVTTPGVWSETEQMIVQKARQHQLKILTVINQCDRFDLSNEFVQQVHSFSDGVITCSCIDRERRSEVTNAVRQALQKLLPENAAAAPPLLGDLLNAGDLAVMVVPIDLQAPRGRLIMPQVQAIRDALDHDAMILALKEDRYAEVINTLTPRPKLVVCDSQVVKLVIDNTPQDIPCTTFSVLFSRLKGDTNIFRQGCNAIKTLRDGDRVLIAEACTHHPTCEDIGRVKIPRLLSMVTQKKLQFDFAPGRDFPDDLTQYSLIVHCGSCMITRQETLWRINCAVEHNIPITNYGMTISYCQGVLDKVLIPQ